MNRSHQGYVLLLALVVGATLFTVSVGLLHYLLTYVHLERTAVARGQAFALAEAGIDKAVYELNQNSSYSGESGLALGAGTITIAIATVDGNTKRITATGYVPNSTNPVGQRTITVTTSVNTSLISFHYGVQVGNGGFTMGSGSHVYGSVYANGSISGSGTITSDAIVAGTSTISNITVNGNATGHALNSCTVGGNATFSGGTTSCTVSGTKYPNSADAIPSTFAISDEQISDWEGMAEDGGTISGPYTLSGTQSLGPKKINGDLTVSNNATLKLTGPLWVNGNVTFSNNSTFTVSTTTGNQGAVLIADAVGNTATKGTIDLSNNTTISGNGNAGSYPLAISTNSGANAINMGNNANSIILFAPYGTISISNGAAANAITAYRLSLSNNASINYLSGLQNASFSDGPGGAWAINLGSYGITR